MSEGVKENRYAMGVDCWEGETKQFIYVAGLSTEAPISLEESVLFEATECLPNEDTVKSMTFDKQGSLYDFGIAAAYLWLVRGQVAIEDDDPESLLIKTWNSLTYILYLGALVDAEIAPCIQSSVSAAALSSEGRMHALPMASCGPPSTVIEISSDRCATLEKQVAEGKTMLDDELFHKAAHALWSYKWIPSPTSQMAILWSGIEALFNVRSELSFRLSYEASLFLGQGKEGYKEIKRLYGERSKAVHGREPIKSESVKASAELLRSLIIKCAEIRSIPNEDSLLFHH